MKLLLKHWRRIAVTVLPVFFAVLHATGVLRLDVLVRLDAIIYDARLRATMPQTMDERIVIVDIDEKSLAEVGRWPWGRNKLANLVTELFERQKVALLGFDVLFAEADDSSGLKQLQQLAQTEFRSQPAFSEKLARLQPQLDYDALFAKSMQTRPIVLGYYLTSDRDARTNGVLPKPVMDKQLLQDRPIRFTGWDGYSANLEVLAKAAPIGGFFNSITEKDGVVRSVPLVAEFGGQHYESLSLAMFRMLVGGAQVAPGFPQEKFVGRTYQGLESILLKQGDKTVAIPVDDRVATLVPFRGNGGVKGGSFQYISASDLLAKRIATDTLKGKIVLLGTTAPGLLDLRVTPVGETYPGVEVHANVISGLLDGKVLVSPDYALGFEVVTLFLSGLTLAFILPLLSAPKAVATSLLVVAALVGLNFWLYLGSGLVLPLASSLVMATIAFALNMSYGYFVESKSKRDLAGLFGTYVPPELVDEMVKDASNYSMKATTKELTVMFCDMRGFTELSETLEPTQLQALLNTVFSRLTDQIKANRGTIDKYMGDCVMAFWGAPVNTPDHASLAVKTALEMAAAIRSLNKEHQAKGLPKIAIGIGLNTGTMCVGDMGSNTRRSYTVVGDSVNLGSRLEGLSKTYGVDIVVSQSTRDQAIGFAWQELDNVRVKGKDQPVTIFWPIAQLDKLSSDKANELNMWAQTLISYRGQDWGQVDLQLLVLVRLNPEKYLYQLYLARVASMRLVPLDPQWDGITNFHTK